MKILLGMYLILLGLAQVVTFVILINTVNTVYDVLAIEQFLSAITQKSQASQ